MLKKIPKIYFGIPIVIVTLVIIYSVLQESNIETFTQMESINSKNTNSNSTYESTSTTDNLFSGPFAILKEEYSVNEPVFLLGSGIFHQIPTVRSSLNAQMGKFIIHYFLMV